MGIKTDVAIDVLNNAHSEKPPHHMGIKTALHSLMVW